METDQAMLDGIPMPLVVIGQDARIRAVNAQAGRVLGGDLVGRLYLTAFRQPMLGNCIEACLAEGRAGVGRYVVPGASSESVYRVIVSPVAQGALCAFEDISEVEQIGQMRRDFVANVSHELRSPLTALLGFIETLQGAAREDPAARARFLSIMAREAGRMNRLVADLLSLSRVEAEERVKPTGRVDLAALVGRCGSDLKSIADDKGVTLVIERPANPVSVPADADQITQVLFNLLENAIKYGGRGKEVTLRLVELPHMPSLRGAAVQIDVTDRGEGIDEIHLPRLTERFYRVDTHRSREQGGTGLGLAIVKHIVNRHRGRLKITSEKGVGSTFSVILPRD